MRKTLFALSLVTLACVGTVNAATPVDLSHQSPNILHAFLNPTTAATTQQVALKELSRQTDFNGTTHIRIQQTVAGYPVWGSDAIVHVPHGEKTALTQLPASTTMNGVVYQQLLADLVNTPAFVFTDIQTQKALAHAVSLYQQQTGLKTVDQSHAKTQLMVFVDSERRAHWAFQVSFLASAKQASLAVPTYILDATTLSVYEQWNNLQTLEDVKGGGLGGNPKMGELQYDGLKGHYAEFSIQRDVKKNLCSLQNAEVTVLDGHHSAGPFSDNEVSTFTCKTADKEHNNVFWSADFDKTNEGYSPANDAMYIGQVIKDMYMKWYELPVLAQFGQPMMLKLNVHANDFSGQPMDNAFFLSLNSEMYFGDGVKYFYPLTSLGVGAHEISHGFTSQHSNLTYQKQSGGLNEAFSDMAAQAAEFYSIGKNSWQIGPEIVKGEGALRYMDDPTKDGKSIANMKDYNDSLNVHYTSGIFNKVFYVMGTSKDWDTKKAFDVMVKANMNYWTANSTFAEAACGVVKATKDYKYDLDAVNDAMKQVGIDIKKC